MDWMQTNKAQKRNPWLLLIVLTVFLFLGVVFIATHALADSATPFVEINNKVGDVSTGHGYVVALGHNVKDCRDFLVIVTTDSMGYAIIKATADKNVVKETLLGRPVRIKAQVTERIVDADTGRNDVRLKILAVKSSNKAKHG